MNNPTNPNSEPKCPECGSNQMYVETTCYWVPGSGWEMDDHFDTRRDTIYCMECSAEFNWIQATTHE